jgi:hypothetical protein
MGPIHPQLSHGVLTTDDAGLAKPRQIPGGARGCISHVSYLSLLYEKKLSFSSRRREYLDKKKILKYYKDSNFFIEELPLTRCVNVRFYKAAKPLYRGVIQP